MDTTILFFVANILYCMAYVVRDMKWLRIVTIVAALATFPYFILREEPLWSAVLWQSAFAGINVINLAWLLREQQPVPLTDEQERLHNLVFRGLTHRQLLRLLDLGEWKDAEPGEVLIQRGAPPEHLLLVAKGQADVYLDGELIAQLVHGRFAGEMGLISDSPASADVLAVDAVRYLRWRSSDLKELMAESTLFDKYLPGILGHDMATKLRETGEFRNLAKLAE